MKSKKNIYIAIGAVGIVVGGLLFLKQTIQKGEITKTVVRKEAGEGSYTENFYAEIDGEEKREIEVQVEERIYTQTEIKEIFREEKQKLEDYIKGENESLDHIVYPLVLKDRYGNSEVEFSFYSDKPDLLNWDGELLSEPDKDGSKVRFFCEMSMQEEKEYWEREICIYPAHLNKNQQIQKAVQDLLGADEQKEKKEVFLPDKIDGKNIRFYRETDKTGLAICLLSVCAAAGFFVREKEKRKKLKKATGTITGGLS